MCIAELSQGKQYWLGLKYSTKWNWIDGTAMDYMNWNGQVTSGSKDTVCADANEPDFYGKWSKQGCYKRLRSICKQTRMLVAIILWSLMSPKNASKIFTVNFFTERAEKLLCWKLYMVSNKIRLLTKTDQFDLFSQ